MIEATALLNLRRLLDTGEKYLEAQLEEEFSMENLEFWHAARDFREKTDEKDRAAETKRIMELYVIDGAEQEVNLPSLMKSKLIQDWAVSMASETQMPPVNLFADAENEIFMLMERDTFQRFKQNPKGVAAAVDDFFQQADKRHDDVVSFEEFKDFAMSRPEMIVAFSQLTETISQLLSRLDPGERLSLAGLLRTDDPSEWENQGSFSSSFHQKTDSSSFNRTDTRDEPRRALFSEDGHSTTDATSLTFSTLDA